MEWQAGTVFGKIADNKGSLMLIKQSVEDSVSSKEAAAAVRDTFITELRKNSIYSGLRLFLSGLLWLTIAASVGGLFVLTESHKDIVEILFGSTIGTVVIVCVFYQLAVAFLDLVDLKAQEAIKKTPTS